MKEKVLTCRLTGLEPFNDFFYCSCFYNALIPVLKKFQVPISAVLCNCLFYYKNYGDLKFGVEFVLVREMNALLKSYGVNIEYQVRVDTLSHYIESALRKGSPVILFIDCFYMPYRTDTFQSKHLGHSILVYGYSAVDCNFYIIEHSDQHTLDFKKMKISYEIIEQAYKGYFKHISEMDNTIYSFSRYHSRITEQQDIQYYDMYLKNCQAIKKKIVFGIKELVDFIESYEELILSPEKLKENSKNLLLYFQYILKAEKGNMSLLQMIHADDRHVAAAHAIYQCWSGICNKIQYSMIRDRYQESSLRITVDLLKKIAEQNDRLYQDT